MSMSYQMVDRLLRAGAILDQNRVCSDTLNRPIERHHRQPARPQLPYSLGIAFAGRDNQKPGELAASHQFSLLHLQFSIVA